MKLFSKGPSSEGPKPMGVRRAFMGVFGMLAVACVASPAFAQYTVEAGKSVQIPIPPAPHQGSWDGPRDDAWAMGQRPTKGTISYPQMQSGNLTTNATYTAGAASSGQDTIRWAFRCEPIGTPWPCGGGSATITIIPAKPSIDDGSITVQYGAPGNVTFFPSPDGVLSIKTPPANGTVTIDGRIATYRGNPGFSGSDSFRVVATNAGGESQPANVTVTVQAPPVPTTAGPETASTVAGQSVRVSYTTTFADSLEFLLAPGRGTAIIDGNDVVYTAAKDWLGTDAYAVRSRGPGGISVFVRTEVTVVAPPPPVLTGGNLSLAFNTSGSHDFAPTSGGTLALASAASHGTVTINGGRATYVPDADFIGSDSFGVSGSNLGGTSAISTVSVTVAPPPVPVLTGGNLTLAFNTSGSHDFAPTNGGSLALASAPSHGTVTISGGQATYVPNPNFIGSDSFGITAANLGGTSVEAITAVTVAAPPPPVASDAQLSVTFNENAALPLPVSGLFSAVTILSQPAHGAVSLAGALATYTPSRGYYGPDSFSYVATGFGGASATATVTVTVPRPPSPSLTVPASVTTPFGEALVVPLVISGLVEKVEIETQPVHGALVVDGAVATYTPALNYVGVDSFSLAVEGPGGRSAPENVAVTVASPGEPVVGSLVLKTGFGQPVTTPLQVSGVYLRLEVSTQPANGSATLDGTSATYTPKAGFAGKDTFEIVAEGPGGRSVPAVILIEVASPPPEPAKPALPAAPSVSAKPSAKPGMSVRIAVTEGMTNGPFKSVELLSQPARGSAAVENLDVVYTAPEDFSGPVEFDYRVENAAGFSPSARMTVEVEAVASEIPVKEASALAGESITVDLTTGVEGGPFTSATVRRISPETAGTAELSRRSAAMRADGAANAPSEGNEPLRLTFVPAIGFYGEAEISYSMINRLGVASMGLLKIRVDQRPDPTNDPKVAAILNAQTTAAARFSGAQVANVSRRMEAMRQGQPPQAAIAFASARSSSSNEPGVDPLRERSLAELKASISPDSTPAGEGEHPQVPSLTPFNIWSGGLIELGERKATNASAGFDFATAGVSAGLDTWLNDKVAAGVGFGAGRDKSDLGDGAKVTGLAYSVFAYGAFVPTDWLYFEGMVGTGRIEFDVQRVSQSGAVLSGERQGSQTFGAATAGLDLWTGGLHISPFGRLEVTTAELKAYAEEGDPAAALRFAAQKSSQVGATFGLSADYGLKTEIGIIRPTARLEYRMALRNAGVGRLGYVEGQTNLPYEASVYAFDDRRLSVGAGLNWLTIGGWTFLLDLEAIHSAGGSSSLLRLGGSGRF